MVNLEDEVSAWPQVSIHPHRFGVGNSASETQKWGKGSFILCFMPVYPGAL
jgi:hypothetical protein